MSKELTPLEAFYEIKKQIGNIHYFDFAGNLPRQTFTKLRDTELFSTIETALKALEIIIKHEVDVSWLKDAKDVNIYNNGIGIFNMNRWLTNEKFDLLKEWLNENFESNNKRRKSIR